MKKFVILMLALMLALTSVSALADPLTFQKTVPFKYNEPEVFEWSIPNEVTLTEAIFSDDGYSIEVTWVSGKVKNDTIIAIELSDDSDDTMYNAEGETLDLCVHRSAYLTHIGESEYIKVDADDEKDEVYPGEYSCTVTFIATLKRT